MTHPIHESVVDLIQRAVALMDDLLRYRIEIDEYSAKLRALDVEGVMVKYKGDLTTDPKMVYYLDALMLLNSLQQQLEFQVAEYGKNVALEDMRTLEELMRKFPNN